MILKETADTEKLAISLIHKKGYEITIENHEGDNTLLYVANNNENNFYANNFISLLGLIELGELRNNNWQLEEEEMDYVLSAIDKLYE